MDIETVTEIETEISEIGEKGYSAYEVAVQNGYEGSEEQWLASLKGTNGTNGQNGITPTIGDNGNWYLGTTDTGKPSRGATGQTGATGQNGADGADGFSPSASVSQSGSVTTISITDKIGTTTASIDLDGYATTTLTGSLSDLTTTSKTNLVSAINELAGSSDVVDISDVSTMNPNTYDTGIYYSNREGSLRIYANGNSGNYIDVFTTTGAFIFVLNSHFMSSLAYIIAFDRDYLYYIDRSGGATYKTSLYDICNNILYKNNTSSFTPTGNYHPATKKYVDDSIASAITTALGGSY